MASVSAIELRQVVMVMATMVVTLVLLPIVLLLVSFTANFSPCASCEKGKSKLKVNMVEAVKNWTTTDERTNK